MAILDNIKQWWKSGKHQDLTPVLREGADVAASVSGGALSGIGGKLKNGLAVGWKAAPGFLWKATKVTSIAGLILGGITVAGMMVASARNNAARRSANELANAQQRMPGMPDFSDQVMMAQPATMMGMQPVEGPMAQRVLASRGQAPNINAAVNPNIEQGGQSVIDGKAIESLGAPVRT